MSHRWIVHKGAHRCMYCAAWKSRVDAHRECCENPWRTDIPLANTHGLEGETKTKGMARDLWRGQFGWYNEHTPLADSEVLRWREVTQ